MQIQTCIEVDRRIATTRNRAEVHTQFQANGSGDVKLIFFVTTCALNDLAVLEGWQGPVVDKESIERIQRITAVDRFADTEGVVPKGQISNRFEIHDAVNLDHDRSDWHARNGHLRAQSQPQ